MTDTEATRSPAELRHQAARMLVEADRVEAEQEAERLTAETEIAERAKLARYYAGVEEAGTALDAAVAMHERCEADLAAGRAEQEHVRALVAQAEQDARAAQAELARAADGDDLDAIADQRVALAKAESVPGLLAPRLERAQRAVHTAQEALERARTAVGASWDTLGHLGARDGLQRPSCLPPPAALPDTAVVRMAREILDAACGAFGEEVGPKVAEGIVAGLAGESAAHRAERLKRLDLDAARLRQFVESPAVRGLVRGATRPH